MKRLLICILTAVVLSLPAAAGQDGPLRERVFLSTDRDVYVAGDRVWLSAWCLDAGTRQLSTFSRTAYVEVSSDAGTVQTAKIALDDGRGAANLILPNTLPTGNYRIQAYTVQGASETGFDPSAGSRIISVFNTFSNARSGVVVSDTVPQAPERSSYGPLSISDAGNMKVKVVNGGDSPALFSLSVRLSDGIPAPAVNGMSDFIGALRSLPAAKGFDKALSEYEGEIIRARVTGTDTDGIRAMQDKIAFISSPGDGSNVYTSSIKADGTAVFYTANIYGDQDMFLEIEGVSRDNVCHLELERPFLDLPAGDLPPLVLCRSYADALRLRSVGMQLEHNFDADTLYSILPRREQMVFDAKKCKSYVLDDYTRFPLMEELFTEFIPELRVRRNEGEKQLQVRAVDALGNSYFPQGTALVLLDGVPVLDHSKILGYDPLLVRRIDIYSGAYFLGIRSFRGVVNFVTYKGTLPSMQFEDNVRIVSFQGCSVPAAYTCEGVGESWPDYRQTIWWHPLLQLGPGESMEIECKAPDYSGTFEVMAEGLTAKGEPVTQACLISSR